MAEDFARKGWHFAEKQDRQPSTSHPSFPAGQTPQRRSYSTILLPHHRGAAASSSGTRGFADHTGSKGAGDVTALLTGDVGNFPARLKDVRNRLLDFMEGEVYPAERVLMDHQMSHDRWKPHPLVEDMKVIGYSLQEACGLFLCLLQCLPMTHTNHKLPMGYRKQNGLYLIVPISLQRKAKKDCLWNMFLPLESDPGAKFGAGFTNLEYAHLAEVMGRSLYASEVSGLGHMTVT